MSPLQARTFTRTAGGAAAVNYAARLELLEHYLAHQEDIVRCSQVTLEWLARHAGVKQSACLAVDAESDTLVGIATHGTVAEEARKLRRERTLFFTIINAVTDPIMLTDTEGRLIVANARAEKLFAASEEESEGRRRAVELNNMLFSAALSRSAVEGSQE